MAVEVVEGAAEVERVEETTEARVAEVMTAEAARAEAARAAVGRAAVATTSAGGRGCSRAVPPSEWRSPVCRHDTIWESNDAHCVCVVQAPTSRGSSEGEGSARARSMPLSGPTTHASGTARWLVPISAAPARGCAGRTSAARPS